MAASGVRAMLFSIQVWQPTLNELSETCETCQRYQKSTQKEPLHSHPAPSRPWEKAGIDIFDFRDQAYLITVDYLSGYFEVDRLPSKRVADIVYCLKQQFARHGLPLEVFSDSSPFNSKEFHAFAAQYDFIHNFTPRHRLFMRKVAANQNAVLLS